MGFDRPSLGELLNQATPEPTPAPSAAAPTRTPSSSPTGGSVLGFGDLHQLELGANAADAVTADLRKWLHTAIPDTERAVRAMRDGFAASKALDTAIDGWQRSVNKLADDVEGLSPRLKETAKLLRGAESTNLNDVSALWRIRR